MNKVSKVSKDYVHIAIAVVIGIILKLVLHEGGGLTELGANVLVLLIPILYLWIFISTGWTSLVALAGLVMLGVYTQAAAWSGTLAAAACIIIIVCIPLNVVLQQTGVTKAIVTWFITRKFVQGKPFAFISMFYLSAFLIGLFFQSITLCVIFTSLASQICEDLGYKKGDGFYKTLMLGVLWISLICNGATPIGHTVPIILMTTLATDTGIGISFGQWMSVGIPVGAVMLVILMLCAKFLWKPDTSKYVNYDVEKMKAERKPLSTEGKIALVLFIIVVFFWVFPDFFGGFLPDVAAYIKTIGVSIPAIFAIALLCIIRVKGKPIAEFGKIMNSIPIPTIIFTGFVTLLGAVVGMESTGINVALQNIAAPLTQNLPALIFIIFALIGTYIMTSFISNTVSMVIFYSLSVAALLTMGVDVVPFVVVLGLVTNMGALMPSASPNAGFFYGTFFEIKDVLKQNLIFIGISAVAFIAIAYPFATLIL